MAGKILAELQQTKPFQYIEEELFLNIHRTSDLLMQQLMALLKPHNLSATQYNVLRILRGAGSAGVTCKEIGGRMITPDPDITRLLDRLEKRKLVTRNRGRKDRRFVAIQITPEGLELLKQLDLPLRQLQIGMFKHVGRDQITELIDLLEEVRSQEI